MSYVALFNVGFERMVLKQGFELGQVEVHVDDVGLGILSRSLGCERIHEL